MFTPADQPGLRGTRHRTARTFSGGADQTSPTGLITSHSFRWQILMKSRGKSDWWIRGAAPSRAQGTRCSIDRGTPTFPRDPSAQNQCRSVAAQGTAPVYGLLWPPRSACATIEQPCYARFVVNQTPQKSYTTHQLKFVVMKILEVTPISADLQVKLHLGRLIADWRTAQIKFVSGIAEHFEGWYSIRPENFHANASASFAANNCTCEIFRGACRIILSPGEMGLTFARAARSDYPIIGEVLQRSWRWLRAEFAEHARGWSSFESSEHLEATDAGAIEPYLRQFSLAGAAEAANSSDGAVVYQPSARATLSDKNGEWMLRRLVEKSEVIPNGVFTSTYIQIQSPEVALAEPFEFLAKLESLADRAVGLDRPGQVGMIMQRGSQLIVRPRR